MGYPSIGLLGRPTPGYGITPHSIEQAQVSVRKSNLFDPSVLDFFDSPKVKQAMAKLAEGPRIIVIKEFKTKGDAEE
jgi:hypothetical protein